MRRAGIILTFLFAALLLTSPAGAQTVYLLNQSTVVTDQQLAQILPALQAQVTEDFAPVWNLNADLSLGSPPPGAWTLTVNDESDTPGAIGYHDVCDRDGHGRPCGYASAVTAADSDLPLSQVISHELLEMLADPMTSTFVKVGTRFYIQEVCDSPESLDYAYQRDGVVLSDFVTPAFFRPGHVGPYDFTGHIEKPLQVLPGGYISWWQNGWHQDFQWIRGRE